jgi:hypothetical protein
MGAAVMGADRLRDCAVLDCDALLITIAAMINNIIMRAR